MKKKNLIFKKLYKIRNFMSSDYRAVRLSFQKFEPDIETDKQPVFIMHGLFGKKTNWYSIAETLCKETDRSVSL